MIKKMFSLLTVLTVLSALILSLPVNADVTATFGQHASFSGLSAGPATGYFGEALDWNGVSELYIGNSTVSNTAGGAQDGDDAYLLFDKSSYGGSNSRIQISSKVTEGKNYVVSFWSQTSAPRSLFITISYSIYSPGSYVELVPWTTKASHEDLVPYGLDPSTYVVNGDYYDEGTPCYDGYFYDGFQHFYVGSDAPGGWVYNSFEVHVPHCADVINFSVNANGSVADTNRAIDNLAITETDTNLVLNGKFDYSAGTSAAVSTVKSTFKGMYPGGLAPTGWYNLNGYDSTGQFVKAEDSDNNYYYASPIAGDNGGDMLMGCQFQQAVTLTPGTYKLSYKRKQITDSAAPQGMVSMRYTQGSPTYSNEPDRRATWLGVVDETSPSYNVVPIEGCSLFPHVVKNQTVADGWVECEVFFEVTKAKAFWITFGRVGETAKFAIDDVVLLPADGLEIGLGKNVTVNSETKTFTWTGQPQKSTWIADAAVTPAGDLTAGGQVQSVLTNSGAEAKSGMLITAVYESISGEKSLVEVKCTEFTAPSGQVTVLNSPALTVPAGGTYTAKTFVWDSVNTLTPIAESVTVQ